MNYGTDAADPHLSYAYWNFDKGDMWPSDPSAENLTAMTNRVFITRWNRFRASREIQLFRLLHSDICNVPLYFLPGVRLQIRLTKGRPSF